MVVEIVFQQWLHSTLLVLVHNSLLLLQAQHSRDGFIHPLLWLHLHHGAAVLSANWCVCVLLCVCTFIMVLLFFLLTGQKEQQHHDTQSTVH